MPQNSGDEFYVQRGASSEHRIKELKLGIKADRLSCQRFIVNQFRLFLSQGVNHNTVIRWVRKTAPRAPRREASLFLMLQKFQKFLK